MTDFLWKPNSEGGLNPGGLSVIVQGVNGARPVGISVNGQPLSGDGRPGEAGYKFYSRQPGGAYGQNSVVTVNYSDGTTHTYNIPDGSGRFEGPTGNPNPSPSSKGSSGGGGFPAGFAPGQTGFGAYPAYVGGMFPNAALSAYNPIGVAPYQFTDPAKFASSFGKASRKELTKNFDLSKELALDTISTEFNVLKDFVPAASALKRSETSADNQFNQQQRTQQVTAVMPNAGADLEAQRQRANSYASGRAPDSVTDAALELGVRSAAADRTSGGGFGATSSVARKASDLMSADKRIELSKYGDQLVGQNIQNTASLFLAPTEYSNAGSQVNVNPSLSPSQLIQSNLSTVSGFASIPASQGLSSTTQQNQYSTTLEDSVNKFNATNTLQNNQYNATAQNQFALGKFDYNSSFASSVAGALQTDISTNLALQQQAQSRDQMNRIISQAQNAQNIGAISQAVTALLGSGAGKGTIGAITSLISSLRGIGGSDSDGSLDSGGASLDNNTDSPFGDGSDSPFGDGSDSPFGDGSNSPFSGSGDGSGSYVPDFGGPSFGSDSTEPTQDGANDFGGSTGDFGGNDGSFGDGSDSGFGKKATINMKKATTSPAETKSYLRSAAATMTAAGVYNKPSVEAVKSGKVQPAGYDKKGNLIYKSAELGNNQDPSAGSAFIDTLHVALDPTGVLSKGDSARLKEVGTRASNPELIGQLDNATGKEFVDKALGAFGADNSDKRMAATAYTMSKNWDKMSQAQKSISLSSLGVQGYKTDKGQSLGDTYIIDPGEAKTDGTRDPGLSVNQAMSLLRNGYNVYQMIDNWGDLSTAQKVAAGSSSALGLAQFAQNQGFIGGGATAGTVDANGEVVGGEAGTNYGQYAQYIAAAYNLYKIGTSDKDTDGKLVDAAYLAGDMYSGGAASNGRNAYRISQSNAADDEKSTRIQQQIGLGVANYFTGGLVGAAVGVGLRTGVGKEADARLTSFDKRTNPISVAAGKVGHRLRYRTEGNALLDLRKDGVDIPDELMGPATLHKGRSKDELVKEAEATGGNVKFAKDRNESDLKPQDLTGYAAFFKKFGNKWLQEFSEQDRLSIAQQALDKGAVREHHGTVDVDWDKVGEIKTGASPSKPITKPATIPNDHPQQFKRSATIASNQSREAQGKSRVQAGRPYVKGLTKMKQDNPYLAGGIMATSIAPTKEPTQVDLAQIDSYAKDNGLNVSSNHKIDYTSDLHYNAAMAGISLGRLLGHGTGLRTDTLGTKIANGAIESSGAKQMTPQSFAAVAKNLRADYAKVGVDTKIKAYAAASVLFSQDRISGTDLVAMLHSFDTVFDPDGYQKAQQFSQGRYQGLRGTGAFGAGTTSKDAIRARNQARFRASRTSQASAGGAFA